MAADDETDAPRSLNAQSFGDTGAVPLVIAHGLFGSARNWGSIAKRLSDRGQVVAVDMRNHGESFDDPDHSYVALAEDLARTVATTGGRADIVGHSMGGKAAMALALRHPDLVRRLAVLDIAPVVYDHDQTDLIAAMQALDPGAFTRRSEADAALAGQVPDPQVRGFLLQSLDLKAGKWRLGLDVLAAQMDQIIGWPDLGGHFDGPVLFLSGGASDYVQADHRAAIRALFPQARFATLPGAGHWLHAERPDAVEATLRAFLDAPA